MTWSLHCRLDRSELDHRNVQLLRLSTIDEMLEENRISSHIYHCLQKENILLLGDLANRSEEDIGRIASLKEREKKILGDLVRSYGLNFAEEDYEVPVIRFDMMSNVGQLKAKSRNDVLDFIPEEERTDVSQLPEPELRREVTEILDKKINECIQYHREDLITGVLLLGAFAGYLGDYSSAGFSQIDGSSGMDQNTQNGLMVLAQFHDEFHNGILQEEAGRSMLKTCEVLAEGIYMEDVMEGEFDLQDRMSIAQLLCDEAVSYALKAPETPETAELLMKIGAAFDTGEFRLENRGTVSFNRSMESAFKAYYYANELGNDEAEMMMRRIKRESAKGGSM